MFTHHWTLEDGVSETLTLQKLKSSNISPRHPSKRLAWDQTRAEWSQTAGWFAKIQEETSTFITIWLELQPEPGCKIICTFDLLPWEKWNVTLELVWTEEKKTVVFCSCWVNCSSPWAGSGAAGRWHGAVGCEHGPWSCGKMNIAGMRRTRRATSWPCRAQGSPWCHCPIQPRTFSSLWLFPLVFLCFPTHALLFGLNPLNNPCIPYYSTWKAWNSSPSVTNYVDWIWAAAHCNQEIANYLPNSL